MFDAVLVHDKITAPNYYLGKETKKGMEFEVETRSSGELCEKLRLVKLKDSEIQPYLNSFISIETVDPSILAPAQTYVLGREIKKIEELRWMIESEYGWDILKLNGYLKVTYPPGNLPHEIGNTIDILPPVMEEHWTDSGKLLLIPSDGQHRCWLAHQLGILMNVVYVRKPSIKYYASPLPNGWDDVSYVEKIPEGFRKKTHIAKFHKKLFRDYNTVFENIGESRPYEK